MGEGGEGGEGAWVKEGDGRESEENKLNDENFGYKGQVDWLRGRKEQTEVTHDWLRLVEA